jgi:uncharacterized protein YdaU (DUF1376 family)
MSRRHGPGARPDTWMPLFWGDYLRDTGHLSTEEHGAYLLLIGAYWCSGGPLPDDDAQLSRIIRCDKKSAWKKLRFRLEKLFEVRNGIWRHKRIDLELAEARQRTETRRNAGKKGADRKWHGHSNANGIANGNAIDLPSVCQWQNDGQSQPQSHKTENSRQRESTDPARGKGGGDPALAVIAAFDASRVRAFGEEMRRPWPRSTDHQTAKGWLDAGLSVAELAGMFDAVHRKVAGQGHAPPEHLSYHQTDVDRLLRARSGSAAHGESGNMPIAADAEEAAWRSRLKQFSKDGFWVERWGPKPGEPGCFVPREILHAAIAEEVLQ